MLSEGRIPHGPAEAEALEALLKRHPGESATLTRRDPGDTGPLLVHIGDATWEINEAGKVSKKRKAG